MAQGYAGVPAGPLSAYLGVREANADAGNRDISGLLGQVQTMGLLQRMQQDQQNRARIDQFRTEIAAADTPEKQIAVATKWGAPKDVLDTISRSQDRKATIEAAQINRQTAGEQAIERVREQALQGRITKEEADRREATMRESLLRLGAQLRPAATEHPPIVQTDDQGVTRLYDRSGNLIKDLGKTGKMGVATLKEQQAKQKLQADLDLVIPNLEAISKDGGLIDQSTGSGAGALVDIGASFFGQATPGSIAVGRLKPMIDPVLKLVPRFEGPQSDKDTQMYKDAAGDLGNPAIPNARKKEAAKTILEIYKRRRGQFSTTDYDASVGPAALAVAGLG